MKNEELIKHLQQFSPDMEVCIYDWEKNSRDDIGDGSSVGIYSQFEVDIYKLDGEEAAYYEDREGKEFVPWIAIGFKNEQYEEEEFERDDNATDHFLSKNWPVDPERK